MSGLSLMCCKRGSNEIIKRSGESGHPCLVPLLILKGLEVTPFTLTVAMGEE